MNMDIKDARIKALTQMLRKERDMVMELEYELRVRDIMAASERSKTPVIPSQVDGIPAPPAPPSAPVG